MNLRYALMAVALIAGFIGVFQSATNKALADRVSLSSAVLLNFSFGFLASLLFYFARPGSTPFFPSGTPWLHYAGGFIGFSIVVSLPFVFSQIGTALSIALIVLGQGVASLLIDHYGLLGLPQSPLTLSRLFGMLLVLAGTLLLRA